MRRFTLAATLLCGAFALPAQAAEFQYFGGLVITDQVGTCPEGDLRGSRYAARYRPANAGDNGPDADLNLFGNALAYGNRLVGRNFDTRFRNVEALIIAGGSGAIPNVQIKFLTNQTNADFVRIEGQIKGFDAQPQCTHTFLLAGVRRPI